MKRTMLLGFLAGALALSGCGAQPPDPGWEDKPLTLEEWKKIPDDEIKYSPRIMDRLKKSGVSMKDVHKIK